jgi:hypothetical protein
VGEKNRDVDSWANYGLMFSPISMTESRISGPGDERGEIVLVMRSKPTDLKCAERFLAFPTCADAVLAIECMGNLWMTREFAWQADIEVYMKYAENCACPRAKRVGKAKRESTQARGGENTESS